MADPFDFSTADPNAPGFLGQSVGFWRDLASFGGNLAAAANQRTASGHLANGTGFAGPLGAATTATMEQGRDNALARSRLAYQNAQTQGAGMQNQLLASQLPLALAKNQMLQRAYSDPSYMQQLMQQFGGDGGGMPGGASPMGGMPQGGMPQGGTLANAVHGLESGGSMAPGITGDGGQAGGPMQVHQAALTDVNRANGTNYTFDQLSADPGLGKKVGDMYLALQQQRFPGRPDLALAAYNAGPTATSRAVQSGQGVAGLPQSTQNYVSRGMSALGGGDAGGGQFSTQQALATAQQYETHANRIELAKSLGFPVAGDPAALRQAAGQWRTMALAGPTESAKGAAGAPFQINRVNAGGVLFDGNGQVKGYAPVQSDEVVTEGPQKGMHVTVLRNPVTNEIVGQNAAGGGAGGGEANGLPAGSIPKTLPPQEVERLKASGEVEGHDLTHDRKMIEDDLSHVVENTIPAKQQLLHLRDLTEPAGTGFAAETRLAFKNAIQTISPDFAKAVDLNASPMQEFQKISTMGAGKQERADQGAKGGFRLMELYLKANPNLENQPDANKHMANLLLVSHQIHEDYATGANDFYQKNRDSFTASPPGKYTPISQYDGAFIQKMRPEVYKSAVDALNGKPYAEWSKGLTGPQMQIVGGVLQRADPNSTVDIQGQQMPVSAFTKTLGPTQISAANGR